MQIGVTLVLAIENGRDVLCFPFALTIYLLAFGITSEGEHLRRKFSKQAVSGQRIHHVTQHRIVDAVSHKANGEVAEQFAHEARGPAFRQVGQPEVTAGNHQPIQVAWRGRSGQQAV
ncbi:hypothetical protein D3C86_1199370 [compost metagenome]